MKFHKRMIPRALLVAEVVIFMWMYCFGLQGIRAVYAMRSENDALEIRLVQEQKSLATLEHDVLVWQENSFVKEKLAREQLQMAREDEEIYLL